MTAIVSRPALNPRDWALAHLAIRRHTDLLDWPGHTHTLTRIEAELHPLTEAAMALVPRLSGHQFTFQGQLFQVTSGWVHQQAGGRTLVQVTCEQLVPESAEQLALLPPLLEAHDDR